jgi:hypothetical protein
LGRSLMNLIDQRQRRQTRKLAEVVKLQPAQTRKCLDVLETRDVGLHKLQASELGKFGRLLQVRSPRPILPQVQG